MKNESASGNREVEAGGQNPLPEDRSKLQNTTSPNPPMRPTIQFQEIPIGQFFEFRGRQYQKLALSMASDEDGTAPSSRPKPKFSLTRFLALAQLLWRLIPAASRNRCREHEDFFPAIQRRGGGRCFVG